MPKQKKIKIVKTNSIDIPTIKTVDNIVVFF